MHHLLDESTGRLHTKVKRSFEGRPLFQGINTFSCAPFVGVSNLH